MAKTVNWVWLHTQEIPKTGLAVAADDYREVNIATGSDKCLDAHVRKHTLPVAEELVEKTQYGSGLNKGATDVGHLSIQAFIDVAKATKTSLAILFIDCKSAYASVVRAWVGPTDVSDNIWEQRLRDMGFVQDDIDAIFTEAKQYEGWYAAGGSEHLLRLIGESHEST